MRLVSALIPFCAEVYKCDLSDAGVHLLAASHFALKTHAAEIEKLTPNFLDYVLPIEGTVDGRLQRQPDRQPV